jgi:oligopeptide transport system ATP-binding protein
MTALLSVRGLGVRFPSRRGGDPLVALEGVSFDLAPGETLGVVGESGCGKSTLARAVLRLLPVSAGTVLWQGQSLVSLTPAEMRALRREMQIVFQDPLDALDPRMTVGESVAEPLRSLQPELPRREVRARVAEMFELVGLAPDHVNRYPHEFSGGQCQRVGIARALVVKPRLVVCDEPVSALDVSIQAQIVNLLAELRRELGLTMIFISHNLSVVRHVSDRILVLYLGRVMELGAATELCAAPLHPYTQALIEAVPVPDPAVERARPRPALAGEVPSPLAPPSGCVFRTRCPRADGLCAERVPSLESGERGRQIACHHWRDP